MMQKDKSAYPSKSSLVQMGSPFLVTRMADEEEILMADEEDGQGVSSSMNL